MYVSIYSIVLIFFFKCVFLKNNLNNQVRFAAAEEISAVFTNYYNFFNIVF